MRNRGRLEILKRWNIQFRQSGQTWQSAPVPPELRLAMLLHYLAIAVEQRRECEIAIYDNFADGPDLVAAWVSVDYLGTVNGFFSRIGVVSAVELKNAGFFVPEAARATQPVVEG